MPRFTALLRFLLSLVFVCSLVASEPDQAPAEHVDSFIWQYCIDCHDDAERDGDISLEHLTEVTPDNALLWKRVWEVVALKEMPPRDEKDQPTLHDRHAVSHWVTSQLEIALADEGGFNTHRMPRKANHIDHDLLFGPLAGNLTPTSTPARIWRITPQEHLVRLNELVNQEPAFNPDWPGARTRGDIFIPEEHFLSFGMVIGWERLFDGNRGSSGRRHAIAPAITMYNGHGLKNYPEMYSIKGGDIPVVAEIAQKIIAYMMYGPNGEFYAIVDRPPNGQDRKAQKAALERGDQIPADEIFVGRSSLTYYNREQTRPHTPLIDFAKGPDVDQNLLTKAVAYLFEQLTFRPPTPGELDDHVAFALQTIDQLGKKDGSIVGLTPLFLNRDALYRVELANYGEADAHGRVPLQGQELMLAINAALSFLPPDQTLKQALAKGQLSTKADVRRELQRMLDDEAIRKPRVLQFFREYFEYDRAASVCKDVTSLENGVRLNSAEHLSNSHRLVVDLDRLIELIVSKDQNVLKELLTTDLVLRDNQHDTSIYFVDHEQLAQKLHYFEWRQTYRHQLRERYLHWGHGALDEALIPLNQFQLYLNHYLKISDLVDDTFIGPETPIAVRSSQHTKSTFEPRLLTRVDPNKRKGILTHPAWLISHSDAMDNHAVHRGIWIRERLLGGAVPDVPITVNAMLPDEPHATLRHRMRVTREQDCWRCHDKIDPLGLTFEMYNHTGVFRTTEKGQPVDASGEILFSGDPELDGPVDNCLEMIDKLANSSRVEQVFVRHAFRFWMGRNETIDDAPILQDAWRAYRDHGGSMKAMLLSLLTSDAFLYRTVSQPAVD